MCLGGTSLGHRCRLLQPPTFPQYAPPRPTTGGLVSWRGAEGSHLSIPADSLEGQAVGGRLGEDTGSKRRGQRERQCWFMYKGVRNLSFYRQSTPKSIQSLSRVYPKSVQSLPSVNVAVKQWKREQYSLTCVPTTSRGVPPKIQNTVH